MKTAEKGELFIEYTWIGAHMEQDKRSFRKQMLKMRDAMPPEKRRAADEARSRRILSLGLYRNAELLLFYVSYRSEADTLFLIRQALSEGRDVAVPKVEGTELVFYRIGAVSRLVEGYRGILEPDTKSVTDEAVPVDFCKVAPEKAVLFLPGCAFDANGGRMGYGGGFYDRFLEKYPELKRVALAYEEQLVEKVPREMHDKRVDVIVTEERTLQTGRKTEEK